jgi:hypothetical protein
MYPDHDRKLIEASLIPSSLRNNNVKEKTILTLRLSWWGGDEFAVLPGGICLGAHLAVCTILNPGASVVDRVCWSLETQRSYRWGSIPNVGEVEVDVASRRVHDLGRV